MWSLFQMLTQSVTFLFNPLSLIIFAFIIKLLKLPSKQNLPPSPSKLPIFGNLLNLGLQPHISLQALSQRHGPLMLLHLGSKPVLIVSSADTAREILKTHDLIFANRPKAFMSDKLLYNYRDVAMAPYGEYWRQMKSILVLHLLSNKRVQSFRHVREEETSLMIRNIKESSSSCCSVNLSEVFARLTNDVVCRVALGRKYGVGEEGIRFKKLLAEFGWLLGVFCIGDYIPWLGWIDRISGLYGKANKVAKEIDCFIKRVVEEHIDFHNGEDSSVKNEDHKDFVDVLLWIRRENSIGIPLDMLSIKALILDMFAAGTDTTYTVLEWAMAELLRHPMVMKKLRNEVRGIADDRADITEDDLEKMEYLKAVIKETLRLHPPIPLLLPRESTQDLKIKGYNIKARTQVIINAWTIGRDPNLWEESEEFKPERFLNNSIDFKGQDFQLIPFGAGRRGCPGIVFASIVNELALANLVHNFEWELADGARAEDLDMTGSSGLTIHRKFPLLVVPTPCSF